MVRHLTIPIRLFLVALSAALLLSCKKETSGGSAAGSSAQAGADLAQDRAAHRTKLWRHGASPQKFTADVPPPGVKRVKYPSGDLKLSAWLSADPGDGVRHPAVVYLHGGFAFGADDWDETLPFR